jgi:hypothetical protein
MKCLVYEMSYHSSLLKFFGSASPTRHLQDQSHHEDPGKLRKMIGPTGICALELCDERQGFFEPQPRNPLVKLGCHAEKKGNDCRSAK